MPLSLRQDRHMVSTITEQSPKSVLKISLYYWDEIFLYLLMLVKLLVLRAILKFIKIREVGQNKLSVL